jgi:hypothetical protein
MGMIDFAILAVKALCFVWALQLIWIGSELAAFLPKKPAQAS